MVSPIIYRVSYMPGGARFQPSTVSFGPFHFVMKSIVWESLGQRPEECCDVDSSEMFWKGKGNQNFTYEKHFWHPPRVSKGLCVMLGQEQRSYKLRFAFVPGLQSFCSWHAISSWWASWTTSCRIRKRWQRKSLQQFEQSAWNHLFYLGVSKKRVPPNHPF